jgi:hypothetical protein
VNAYDFSSHISVAVSRTAIFSLILLAFIWVYGKQWRGWIAMAGMVAFFAILDFIFPLILQRGKGSYRDKLTAQAEAEENNRTIGRLLNARFGNVGVTTLLIIMYGLSLAYAAGRAHGEQQEEFLVIDQSPEVVVLRIYGEYLITAPVDRSTKEVEKKFVILKLSDNSPTSLTLEKVGPLKVKP